MMTEEERSGDTNEQKDTTRETVPLLAVLAKRPAAVPQSAEADPDAPLGKEKTPALTRAEVLAIKEE